MTLARTLEKALSDHGAHYSLEHHAQSMTSRDLARVARVDEEAVVKSVVLEDDRGFVLAVLPASKRVEFARVSDECGRSLHLCAEHDIARLFPDCEFGAVPPVGYAYGLPTLVDASLEERDEVFFEAGDHETLVRMDGGEFLDLLDEASIAEIATENTGLTSAIVRCEELYRAQLSVGRAIGAPVGSGPRWRKRLETELDRLLRAFEDHILETESAEGLLNEVIEQAPRLWREVDGLRAEHTEIRDECGELLARVGATDASRALRKRVHDLLGRLERHRYRGADLVYATFGVDLGGG